MDELQAGDRIVITEMNEDGAHYDGSGRKLPMPQPGDKGTIDSVGESDRVDGWTLCWTRMDSGHCYNLFSYEFEKWYTPANDPTRYERSLL